MTERRRFFPARPVQQVPGQTVGLQGRLRPVAAPAPVAQAAGGDVGDVACTGWLAPWLCGAEFLSVDVLPGGETEITGPWQGMEVSLWQGTPLLLDEAGFARPVPGGDFVCTEIQINSSLDADYREGGVMAVAPGGVWEFEWDAPSGDPANSVGGRSVIVAGDVLAVVIPVTSSSSEDIETLTARAFAGDALVMELVLRVRSFAI